MSDNNLPPSQWPETAVLDLHFDGTYTHRGTFLRSVQEAVYNFSLNVGLCQLFHEIVKNIYDHANGRGSLHIERVRYSYTFVIKDEGTESYDFLSCVGKSRLAGNGINLGFGLQMIPELAEALGIDLKIDTSRGFCYSGTYHSRKEGPA